MQSIKPEVLAPWPFIGKLPNVIYSSGSQLGMILLRRGHLGMPGDILVVRAVEKCGSWHRVGRQLECTGFTRNKQLCAPKSQYC